MKNEFKDISYLANGNEKQKRSYLILKDNKVMQTLLKYKPLLVGTIPINIDVNNSDLDIVCEVDNFEIFETLLKEEFSKYSDFYINYNKKDLIIVCSFKIDEVEIEIYGSKTKSSESNGYRHMMIENRILKLLGNEFRLKVINLKESGLKTEPSFAKLLNLKGNPYEELLLLEKYSDEYIIKQYESTKIY